MPATYDFLIVGSGLYGAVFAQQAFEAGKKCLVLERRPHLGGNLYTQRVEGVEVHRYGAHIFHTNNESIWRYVNRFAAFNRFVNMPVANYKGEIYNLPFNMNTFNRMWGVVTPAQAQEEIERQRKESFTDAPQNLEQTAINLVGSDIYKKLIKGYTEKQWGRPCTELPPGIIRRLPVRFTYDNNYFNAAFQGIPVDGYTSMIEKMLCGVDVVFNEDYLKNREKYSKLAPIAIYSGPIDEYFGYRLKPLEYRSLRFETKTLDMENYQGNALVNYTDRDTPYTRVIEHKHFNFGRQPKTVVTWEFSHEWSPGEEPYYPIEDEANLSRYGAYRELAEKEPGVIFGGRLGAYKYFDMDQVIEQALKSSFELLERY
ncbi:MAG: UDP-galactopyranose mutase [Clostridiales bacterium]|jgi:UDP-galactopyranose mutase|nr:UDP-galactopyranose mutase [Clostridiales bacterium]